MSRRNTPASDTIDLGEIAAAMRRGWRWVPAGVALGLMAALLVTLVLREEYEARATVLLKASSDRSSPALGRMGGLDALLDTPSEFETEMQVLRSRAVMGAVVDSLGLRATVADPGSLSLGQAFTHLQLADPRLEGVYRFRREGDAYRVRGPGAAESVRAGLPQRVPGLTFTLRAEGLPDAFTLEVVDRESAIDQVEKKLDASRAGGEVAELVFRSSDRFLAAAVPNAMVAEYLARRKTVDRGVNQHRSEFIVQQIDSVAGELTLAEANLRRHQEATGTLDPELAGEAEFRRVMELRGALEELEIEERALRQVVRGLGSGTFSARDVAAYPTFLRTTAINDLLSRLMDFQVQRLQLLEGRTERDPDVMTVTRNIEYLEREIESITRAYLNGIVSQQVQLRAELSTYRATSDNLPALAEQSFGLQREVKRLTETLLALQTQLVQTRLAAIGEGGEVRVIDTAVPPRDPSFPNPLLNLMIGLLGGLMLGSVGALGSGYLGSRVRDPREAELAAGVPAVAFNPRTPLLLAEAGGWRTLLVLPVSTSPYALQVAHHLAASAALKGNDVALAEMDGSELSLVASGNGRAGGSGAEEASTLPATADQPEIVSSPAGADYHLFRSNGRGARVQPRLLVEQLEARFSRVIVAASPVGGITSAALLSHERPVLLVADTSRTRRRELREAVESLERLDVPVVGVVLLDARRDAAPL
jgi:uncharacterized protein involved in exopolysaccharide biosynthesis